VMGEQRNANRQQANHYEANVPELIYHGASPCSFTGQHSVLCCGSAAGAIRAISVLTAQIASYIPEIVLSEPNCFRRGPGDRQPGSRSKTQNGAK
jgi:hypothetical protein